jgi:hypothetical protein
MLQGERTTGIGKGFVEIIHHIETDTKTPPERCVEISIRG